MDIPTQAPEQPQAPLNFNLKNNSLLTPIAIVVAGALIAAGLYYSHGGGSQAAIPAGSLLLTGAINADTILSTDHLQGSPNADITLVEYSDLECPFCKQFQTTVDQLMADYASSGTLAWVYRQFPLYRNPILLHPRAEKEAEASECAASIGGNAKFWQYIENVFQTTTSNNTLDPAKLPVIAQQVGLDVTAFNTCLSSGKYTQLISDDFDKAIVAGAQGTPYSILFLKNKLTEEKAQAIKADINTAVTSLSPGASLPADTFIFDKGGQKISVNGSLPYALMKAVIDSIEKNDK
jgi:protein-disulfide isomerase